MDRVGKNKRPFSTSYLNHAWKVARERRSAVFYEGFASRIGNMRAVTVSPPGLRGGRDIQTSTYTVMVNKRHVRKHNTPIGVFKRNAIICVPSQKKKPHALPSLFATADGVCPFGNPGRNFDLSARLPITLMMLAVAVTFSPALPVLFPMVALYLIATYFGDKFYLLRACCTPPQVRSQHVCFLLSFEKRRKPSNDDGELPLLFWRPTERKIGQHTRRFLTKSTPCVRLGYLGA